MTILKIFQKKSAPPACRRIHLMDELRGFAVVCMVFYHAFYTLSFLLGWQWCKDLLNFFLPAEPWFAGLFIFLSGIASNLSRSNLKRGLKLLAVALVVSAVTILVVPSEPIYFGILHLLSISMILVGLTKKWLDKIPVWIGLAVCAAGILFTMYLYRGFLGFGSIPLIHLPRSWYTTDWLMPLGIYSSSFFPRIISRLSPGCLCFSAALFSAASPRKANSLPSPIVPGFLPWHSWAATHWWFMCFISR